MNKYAGGRSGVCGVISVSSGDFLPVDYTPL